jgi:tetratricopeptide (TPR) repeat protein
MRSPDKNQIYQQGIALKREKRFLEALACFREISRLLDDKTDADLLFNLGVCYWRLGNLGPAVECFEQVLKINQSDPDAENILRSIRTVYPHQLVDFQKDGAILDANFVINYCNSDFQHFPRFLRKARKRFNFYTSLNVYAEMIHSDSGGVSYSIQQLQQLLEESLIVELVPTKDLEKLEARLLADFPDAPEIKARHMGRPHAWYNDLSLICLLTQIKNPIHYIVTNDRGITQIIHFLHDDKDPSYYLRSNDLFLASVDQLCRTATRAHWEKQLYSQLAS